MGVFQVLKSFLGLERRVVANQVEEKSLENLAAIVVPKELLLGVGREIYITNTEEFKKYFDNCASGIGNTLVEVYGHSFDLKKAEKPINKTKEQKLAYFFEGNDLTVSYEMGITSRSEPESEQKFVVGANGLFMIEKPQLDFQKAQLFINAIMQTHLLAYNPWKNEFEYVLSVL